MIYISHRGNINGINKKNENHPDYVYDALKMGFDVEVDVWTFKDKLYLGHDEPQYEYKNFLDKYKNKLWFHAKNLEALDFLKEKNYHYFWHQEDDVTITSKGYWWTYPGKKLFKNSICVLPEQNNQNFNCSSGCCSDIVLTYKKENND